MLPGGSQLQGHIQLPAPRGCRARPRDRTYRQPHQDCSAEACRERLCLPRDSLPRTAARIPPAPVPHAGQSRMPAGRGTRMHSFGLQRCQLHSEHLWQPQAGCGTGGRRCGGPVQPDPSCTMGLAAATGEALRWPARWEMDRQRGRYRGTGPAPCQAAGNSTHAPGKLCAGLQTAAGQQSLIFLVAARERRQTPSPEQQAGVSETDLPGTNASKTSPAHQRSQRSCSKPSSRRPAGSGHRAGSAQSS